MSKAFISRSVKIVRRKFTGTIEFSFSPYFHMLSLVAYSCFANAFSKIFTITFIVKLKYDFFGFSLDWGRGDVVTWGRGDVEVDGEIVSGRQILENSKGGGLKSPSRVPFR
jgi:hypothetical protein